eukprot:s217_g20.t1
MEWLRRALTTDLVVPGTTFGARTVVVAILFTIFVSLMVAFFLLTFNHSGWFELMILVVISFFVLAAISCVYKDPRALSAVDPMEAKSDGKVLWAACTYEMLESRLEFRYFWAKAHQHSDQWARSPPVIMPAVQVVQSKTCLCCLEELQPRSQVVVLPCGHVYHQECIASWSFSSSAGAASCPSCRIRYDGDSTCRPLHP